VRTLIEEGKKAAIEAAAMAKPVLADEDDETPAPGGEVTANEPAHE
jgi:hypothetical protein